MRLSSMLLATALLGFVSAASADPGERGHHGEDELFRGVAMTDAQKAEIRKIEQAGWAQAKSGFQQMRGVHEQIMARLLAPGSVSEADLAPLMQQEQALRAQLEEQRLASALQIRQVLTPQQLAEAAEKHQQLESLHDQERQISHPADTE